ncbi:MAG: glycerol-3-phosphate 1-O-acyltransferase PlsY [Candidatus Gastranaerophilales bacterium]|nr:glycerol-3-phosphate 1-O-acyltransferase PlsY [Candidatus Gastranaerophilales bacterium]
MITTICYLIGIVLAAYIIGSFPTGYLVVKVIKGIDIRKEGSGSTGATNVKRILGKRGFFGVMFIDLFKGMLPVIAAKYLEVKFNIFPEYSILPVLAAIAVLIGHSKSIFLGFSGGKSVASGVGTIFGLSFPVGAITAITWAIITYFSKYVSLGSVIAVMLTGIWMIIFAQPTAYVVYCFAGGLYIVYLHRENIKRLLNGNENKVR